MPLHYIFLIATHVKQYSRLYTVCTFLPKYRKVISYIIENHEKQHAYYRTLFDKCEKSLREEKQTFKEDQDVDVQKKTEEEEGIQKEEKREEGKKTRGGSDDNPSYRPPSHIVEAFLQERLSRGEDVSSFTYSQLCHVVGDLFGAGTDTALTTLRWHFLYMALNPDIQARVHTELDTLFAEDDLVEERCLQDRADSGGIPGKEGGDATADGKKGASPLCLASLERLPFTQACLMESQRLGSVVPLGVPHGVSKDLHLGSYVIPKGTMLLPLLWHIHHDPKEWKDPHKYFPERFLDAEGRILSRIPAFHPFQIGRRMCIGDEYGRMVLSLFSAQVLLEFNLALDPRTMDDPTADPECGLTLGPRPHKLVLTPRK
ncbi:cytochrome P450 306a1-like [Oratosquilla oratoria]|uniref:cytochrome P450 306a1-like n=1 Tax=Oratosquilla oratoria TaxID=337810 RepID=UPI003F7691B9